MLKIRSEQIEAFKPVAEAAFLRRVAEHLMARHAGAVVRLSDRATTVKRLDDETLLTLVRGAVGRARGYGLRGESALAAFVVTMFLTSPNFDEHPLVRRALTDKNVPPDAKMARLLQTITAKNLKVVKDSYDPSAWQPEGAGGGA